jgi:hypothetical protein
MKEIMYECHVEPVLAAAHGENGNTTIKGIFD